MQNRRKKNSGKKKVTCPKDAALVTDKATILEQKGVNTYDFDLTGVGKNAEFKIWFYTNQDRNFAYVGLREPIPGLVLKEGDHVKIEIKTQQYGARNVDVLMKLFDSNMQLKTICGIYHQDQVTFISDKIEVRATNIKSLNKISCLATPASAKKPASLKTAADDADNVPFKIFSVAEAERKIDVSDKVKWQANSSVTPLSFSNESFVNRSTGRLLGASQTDKNASMQILYALVTLLGFTLFTVLLKRKFGKTSSPSADTKQIKTKP